MRITVPEFAGTRWLAGELLGGAEGPVVLDLTGTRSAAQGFCDELVGRSKPGLTVIGCPQHAVEYFERAARLRERAYTWQGETLVIESDNP